MLCSAAGPPSPRRAPALGGQGGRYLRYRMTNKHQHTALGGLWIGLELALVLENTAVQREKQAPEKGHTPVLSPPGSLSRLSLSKARARGR